MGGQVAVLKKAQSTIYKIMPFLVPQSIIEVLEIPYYTKLLELGDIFQRQFYPLGFEGGSGLGATEGARESSCCTSIGSKSLINAAHPSSVVGRPDPTVLSTALFAAPVIPSDVGRVTAPTIGPFIPPIIEPCAMQLVQYYFE